jgi:hypothetical protein
MRSIAVAENSRWMRVQDIGTVAAEVGEGPEGHLADWVVVVVVVEGAFDVAVDHAAVLTVEEVQDLGLLVLLDLPLFPQRDCLGHVQSMGVVLMDHRPTEEDHQCLEHGGYHLELRAPDEVVESLRHTFASRLDVFVPWHRPSRESWLPLGVALGHCAHNLHLRGIDSRILGGCHREAH